MAASGISAAQVAAHKFAIEPNAGQLVYLETTSQTIYTFSGAALPATINPAVAWGATPARRSTTATWAARWSSPTPWSRSQPRVRRPRPSRRIPRPGRRRRDRHAGPDHHGASDRLIERLLGRQRLDPALCAPDQLLPRRPRRERRRVPASRRSPLGNRPPDWPRTRSPARPRRRLAVRPRGPGRGAFPRISA